MIENKNRDCMGFGNRRDFCRTGSILCDIGYSGYGYCFTRTDEFRSHAISNMTGTSGRQRVPESCFNEYKVVKPPMDVILAFGDLSKKIFLQIKNNAEILDIFTKTRDILLPKLMSGKIRV